MVSSSTCNDLGIQLLTHFHELAQFSVPALPATAATAVAVPSIGVFLSPVGLAVALVLLLNGVKEGSVSHKQLHTLVAPRDAGASHLDGRVNDAYAEVLKQLAVGNFADLQVRTAIFLRDGQYHSSFLERMSALNASAFPLRDHQDIQRWVDESTGGLLKDLGNVATGAQDGILLGSTATFHGVWPKPFDPKGTEALDFMRKDGTFITVNALVAEFKGQGVQSATIDEQCRALKLPYSGGVLSAIGVLPRSADQLKHCLTQLHKLSKFAWSDAHVEVWLPPFEIATEINAAAPLRTFGLSAPFEQGEDIADALYVASKTEIMRDEDTQAPGLSALLHKALIRVDGSGASHNAIAAGSKTAKKDLELFRFDHPFVWAVQHDMSSTLVMIGIIVQPGGQTKPRKLSMEEFEESLKGEGRAGQLGVEIKSAEAKGQQQGNVKAFPRSKKAKKGKRNSTSVGKEQHVADEDSNNVGGGEGAAEGDVKESSAARSSKRIGKKRSDKRSRDQGGDINPKKGSKRQKQLSDRTARQPARRQRQHRKTGLQETVGTVEEYVNEQGYYDVECEDEDVDCDEGDTVDDEADVEAVRWTYHEADGIEGGEGEQQGGQEVRQKAEDGEEHEGGQQVDDSEGEVDGEAWDEWEHLEDGRREGSQEGATADTGNAAGASQTAPVGEADAGGSVGNSSDVDLSLFGDIVWEEDAQPTVVKLWENQRANQSTTINEPGDKGPASLKEASHGVEERPAAAAARKESGRAAGSSTHKIAEWVSSAAHIVPDSRVVDLVPDDEGDDDESMMSEAEMLELADDVGDGEDGSILLDDEDDSEGQDDQSDEDL